MVLKEAAVTARDFTNPLQAMKIRNERIGIERRKGWGYQLDALGKTF